MKNPEVLSGSLAVSLFDCSLEKVLTRSSKWRGWKNCHLERLELDQ